MNRVGFSAVATPPAHPSTGKKRPINYNDPQHELPYVGASVPHVRNGKMHFADEVKRNVWLHKKEEHLRGWRSGPPADRNAECGTLNKMERAAKCAAYMEAVMEKNKLLGKDKKVPIDFDTAYRELFPKLHDHDGQPHNPTDRNVVLRYVVEYWEFGKILGDIMELKRLEIPARIRPPKRF